jgi:hypothetical protein
VEGEKWTWKGEALRKTLSFYMWFSYSDFSKKSPAWR